MTLQQLAILIQKKAAENPDKEVCCLVVDPYNTQIIACTWESKNPTLTPSTIKFLKQFK